MGTVQACRGSSGCTVGGAWGFDQLQAQAGVTWRAKSVPETANRGTRRWRTGLSWGTREAVETAGGGGKARERRLEYKHHADGVGFSLELLGSPECGCLLFPL